MYPGILGEGGNTGTVNSFTGVDLSDVTGGVYNAGDLTDPNKLSCYLLQASLQGMPDIASPLFGAAGSVLGWATQQLGTLNQQFGCPQLKNYNNALFDKFPGASYKGSGD